MEYSPPPLFKQGASARAKVVVFSLIAIALLVTDSRVHSLSLIRQVIGSALYPLQMAALVPRDTFNRAGDYFSSQTSLEQENRRLTQQQSVNAQMLQQSQQLYAENAQLRKLLGASERLPVKSLMSEILYDARDAFTRIIVLDRGSQNGVAPGQPVIDDIGVVGQVTRVFPFTAEVTLLTDKDQAISVQVVRSGLRSVAYGRGQSGVLDLKFMATNADIQKGDTLVTSGIDGVFPAGLAVAKVVQVENKSNDAFAHIVCQPAAGIDRNRQLLVLLVDTKAPRAPDELKDKKDKFGRHHVEAAKETNADNNVAAPAAYVTTSETVRCEEPRAMNNPHYILLPVSPVFIAFSLTIAFLLNLLPWGHWIGVPDFVALVVIFWSVHQPRRVGIGVAFFMGLLMDVHDATLLGENALAYTLLSYFAIMIHRRVLWFPVGTQTVHVLPLLLLAKAAQLLVRLIVSGKFPGWLYFIDSVVAAALWPIATWLLLAPQRRAIDRDETRPI